MKVIIGGGAAGLFAAIRCKEQNPTSPVIVLEKTNQLLAKVRISGGGRCNVTHHCFDPIQLARHYPRGSKELVGPFHYFQPKDMVAWLAARGVEVHAEEDGRMFPVTNSSETIIECLLKAAFQAGVEIRKQQRIQSLEKTEAGFLIQLAEEKILASQVLLATGSSSWGYEIAKSFGHTLIEPVPSLFTFNVPTSPLLDLSGIAVPNVIVKIKDTALKQQGPLLLTHWGFSGPAVLKLSAWAARELHALNYKATVLINWISAANQEVLYQSLLERRANHPLQGLLQGLPNLLPNNLITRLLEPFHISPTTPLGKLSNKILVQVAAKLCSDPYAIDGKTTYKQEFVTAGGVGLKEIDFKTMQSTVTPGLFFAGEILNIDGITGGFNFQNAWTTGWLAGTAMSTSK